MGIYAIHGPRGCIYIGSAVSIQQRWRCHRYDLRRGEHHSPHFQRAWNKYGENAFAFEVLEEIAIPENLLVSEQKWLDEMFANRPITAIYNNLRTAGSSFGFRHSEETKQHASEIRKGIRLGPMPAEHRTKISIALKGRKLTPVQIEQNALAQSGGKVYTIIAPDMTRYPNIINMSAFARDHNLHENLLRMVLRGERDHTEGWTGWVNGSEPQTPPSIPKYTFISPTGEIYANVIYPGRFARQYNLTISAVWRVLKGEHKQHKGWTGFIQEPT
jgi:group I intron endonuclease